MDICAFSTPGRTKVQRFCSQPTNVYGAYHENKRQPKMSFHAGFTRVSHRASRCRKARLNKFRKPDAFHRFQHYPSDTPTAMSSSPSPGPALCNGQGHPRTQPCASHHSPATPFVQHVVSRKEWSTLEPLADMQSIITSPVYSLTCLIVDEIQHAGSSLLCPQQAPEPFGPKVDVHKTPQLSTPRHPKAGRLPHRASRTVGSDNVVARNCGGSIASRASSSHQELEM